jgi:uncharacterized membrane protein
VALLLIGAALRVVRLDEQGFWFDELFGVYYARFPLAEMYRGIALEGTKLPLYYTLLHALMPTMAVELLLRLLSAAFGLLCIPLLFVLVRRWLNAPLAWWSAVLLTVNPFHFFFSREARPYTLLLCLSLVSLLAYTRLLMRRNRRWWVVYIIAHMTAYITNLFALFIPLIEFLYSAIHVKRTGRLLRGWVLANAIAVIPLALWYAYTYVQREGQLRLAATWFPLTTLPDLAYTFWNFTFGFLPPLDVPIALALLFIAALVVAGVRHGYRFPRHRFSLLLLWLLPVLLVWLIGLRRPLYGDRYLIITLPVLLVLLSLGLLSTPHGLVRRVVQAALVGAMLWGCWQIVDHPLNQREQWREAAQLLESIGTTTTPIYTAELNAAVALSFYYRGAAAIIPLPPADGEPFREAASPGSRFWLVLGYSEFSPHHLGQPFRLDWDTRQAEFVDKLRVPPEAVVKQSWSLPGVTVVLYER